MNKFTLNLNDTMIWNQLEFVEFLADRQGLDIVVDTNAEGYVVVVAAFTI